MLFPAIILKTPDTPTETFFVIEQKAKEYVLSLYDAPESKNEHNPLLPDEIIATLLYVPVFPPVLAVVVFSVNNNFDLLGITSATLVYSYTKVCGLICVAEVMTNSNSNKIGTVGTSFGAVNTQITTPGIYAWNFNNLNYTSTLFFIVSSDLGKVTLLNETWFSKNITFAKNDEGYLTVTYTGANATVLFTRIAGV